MGVAAYNRGTTVIRRDIARLDRPVEFVLMDELNSLPKYPDAGTPFSTIHFVPGRKGWWAECPKTGHGYWYKTLREAVRRWRVRIISVKGSAWVAEKD